MDYRQFGKSCGLRISPLTFGTITFGGASGMEYLATLNATLLGACSTSAWSAGST